MNALTWAQVLVELVQNKPVVVVQSEVPHEQGAELIEAPSVVEHGAALLQELMDAVQNNPVVEVQTVDPHVQSTPAVLAVDPSVTAHGSGLRRQQSDAAHTVVAQLTADKSFFNEWPVEHDEKAKGVLPPSILSHVGVVQHSL